MVCQGQFNLLLISQYWSDIHFIPLSSQGLLCMTGSPIKWNSCFASLLTKAKRNWLVCRQFEVELLNIIVHKLLHLLNHPYWKSKCKIIAFWQLEACTSSNIVLTTYCTASSNIYSFCTTVNYTNTREVALFIKEIACKLVPMSTCCVFVQRVILNQCSVHATFSWSNTRILPCSSQFNSCLTSGYTQIEMLYSTCLKCTIINPLINTHTCWNWYNDWNGLRIWAVHCQLSNHPCILI